MAKDGTYVPRIFDIRMCLYLYKYGLINSYYTLTKAQQMYYEAIVNSLKK